MRTSEGTLYKRLGGRNVVEAIAKNFTLALQNDSHLAEYFDGIGREQKYEINKQVIKMLAQYTGGPAEYTGKRISQILAPLGIAPRDWEAAMGHLLIVMDEQGIQKTEVNEMMTMMKDMQKELLEKQGMRGRPVNL